MVSDQCRPRAHPLPLWPHFLNSLARGPQAHFFDTVQAHLIGPALVQSLDAVVVDDSNHSAGEDIQLTMYRTTKGTKLNKMIPSYWTLSTLELLVWN